MCKRRSSTVSLKRSWSTTAISCARIDGVRRGCREGRFAGFAWRVSCLYLATVTATFSFAKNLKTATKGAKTVVVVAPGRAYTNARLGKLFSKKLGGLLVELAKDAKGGEIGGCAATLTLGEPRRLAAVVLPDAVSRYNCPARPECITRLVGSIAGSERGKVTVVLVLDDAEHYLAAANAVARAFPKYMKRSGRMASARVRVVAVASDGTPIAPAPRLDAVTRASRDAAELVDTPPSELHPEAFAERAKEMLGSLADVSVKEIVGEQLLTHGLAGIHTVGRCAISHPRLVVATYTPKHASDRHIALVGKGVTYDTGGLNLKISGNMESMKCDMGGAAAVLGAFRVLAERGCPHQVSLLLCMAENAIGPAAYKPDDIITMHSGKTVEINNTDAEGRLLLGDGVSYAARVLRADTVFDAATLTGAQAIATGQNHAAVVSNDGELEATMLEVGRRCGDLVHPLPFAPEFYKREFKSTVADMRNSVENRANAQSSCAAQFVYWHMEDTKAKWCHIDLAAPAFGKGRASGFGVALIAEGVQALT
ncbi:MAG: leucyl aminopeptidase family protein [Myxococcales bacterium FL481]|nr:MAG: leucyl aminopeptidase family protein [Myxococcales bacterium FL481]